jgi:hypothetical protein
VDSIWLLMTPGPVCHEGIAQKLEIPPPEAQLVESDAPHVQLPVSKLQSFQTVSPSHCPLDEMLSDVPPTDVTYG